MRKRRAGPEDFSPRSAQAIPAHRQKVRAPVFRFLDRQRLLGNARAIPRHERTATNRCKAQVYVVKSTPNRHPERSAAKSKDPAELREAFRYGVARLRPE